MKSDYRIRAEKLIRRVYPYIKNCRTPEQVRKCIRTYNEEHHSHILVHNGAARFALIYSDYVIKFDYGAGKEWAGGCKEEYQKYTEVIAPSPFSYLFAEMTKIQINKKDIYIMPRVKGVGESRQYWNNLTIEEHRFIDSVTADMHSGNYGRYNRKPKIIDYAMAP